MVDQVHLISDLLESFYGPFSTFKELCDYIETTQTIQYLFFKDNLKIIFFI